MTTTMDLRRASKSARAWFGGAVSILLLLSLGWGDASAGSAERKGTGGALELRIPVGPRGVALGGTSVADEVGVEALFWNPAGIAGMRGTELLFTHTNYFADMDIEYVAVATDLKSFGSLGFTVKALSIGNIIVTTEDAPDGTGAVIDPTFTVFGLSYARRFTDRVLFGGTANLVTERIENVKASGVAFDLGVQYLTGWNGLQFGFVMKNFGTSMQYSGSDLETNLLPPGSDPTAANRTFTATTASFDMPSYFSLAAKIRAYEREDHYLAVLGAFQNNNFVGDDLRAGAEWNYKDTFALRGSYYGSFTNTDINVNTGESTGKFRGGDDLYNGIALGAGVGFGLGQTAKANLDVSWRSVRDYFDDTFEFGIRLGF